jgi:hypothetical protein
MIFTSWTSGGICTETYALEKKSLDFLPYLNKLRYLKEALEFSIDDLLSLQIY